MSIDLGNFMILPSAEFAGETVTHMSKPTFKMGGSGIMSYRRIYRYTFLDLKSKKWK